MVMVITMEMTMLTTMTLPNTREEQYTPSSLDYSKAAPGVGAVLRAIAEANKLQQI